MIFLALLIILHGEEVNSRQINQTTFNFSKFNCGPGKL